VGQFPGLMLQMGPIGPLLRLATSLGTILLILVVFQEDAVASVRHDWLTRPIPGTTQLLAKLLFVLLVVIAPTALGGIANSLSAGRSVGESLLAGLGGGTSAGMLTLLAVTMSVAAVTGTVRQAMIATLGAFAFFAAVALLTNRMRDEAVPLEYSGSFWVVNTSLQWLLLIALVAVLVVQYRRRHTRAARLIVGAAVALGCGLLMLLTWPRVFALQKMLSPEPAAASPLDVQLEQACFPARVLDAAGAGGRAGEIRPDAFSEEQRDRAGADAIAFNTRLAVRGVPEGNLVRVGSVVATWRAGGTQLARVLPGESRQKWTDDEGVPAVDHFWLLRRTDHEALAVREDVQTQLHYAMTLLAPTATAEFVADGQRAWHPGIGYCSAEFDRSQGGVQVDCYKWGAQPALLTANIVGRPDMERQVSAPPDYTPALIDFWGGQRHNVTLKVPGPEVPRVIVTAYRARAHFDRHVTAPGVLGGPPSACAAPAAAQ
jgi:hypothetical protein